jgi:hypothetical protein
MFVFWPCSAIYTIVVGHYLSDLNNVHNYLMTKCDQMCVFHEGIWPREAKTI